MSHRVRAWATVLTVMAPLSVVEVSAQLISPGRLSAAHAELAGIRSCTACHRLRTRGVSRELCLDCHRPLAERLGAERGFHATLVERDCASCHKEHLGPDFDLVRMDTLAFDHRRTGFPLDGAHSDAGCRDCHAPSRITDPAVRSFKGEAGGLATTFLGLSDGCGSCHLEDDPHGGQFADRVCADCHDTHGWQDAPRFDHQRSGYPLEGAHRAVSCEGCHTATSLTESGAVRYTPVPHDGCARCHADPHRGAMAGACGECHSTEGWRSIERGRVAGLFDHASTAFPLAGRHATLRCAACHDPRAPAPEGVRLEWSGSESERVFPAPDAGACVTCHLDPHAEESSGGRGFPDCSSCHGEEGWRPSSFGLGRHRVSATFLLEGAHRAVPCSACHRPDPDGPFRIVLGSPACRACHAADDPHGDQFGVQACDDCHRPTDFARTTFDHARTSFPLAGAHGELSCLSCHRSEAGPDGVTRTRWALRARACRDCHGDTSS